MEFIFFQTHLLITITRQAGFLFLTFSIFLDWMNFLTDDSPVCLAVHTLKGIIHNMMMDTTKKS